MFNQYEDLLNVEELCEILGVGKNIAYGILNSGEIKAFRTGRIWKIPKIAVEDYILIKSGLKRQ
ncbi:helix-turn-helix domain-containing protein [Desnuesiella massiliensis]|uniref:helix-turn-helix domain-containing protein n=1 Tax=Desnuesiella massiliensis TaxID=1650662 RepID=UPI0006E36928|nr:helix-turn-helix domain-containing protein [Desnuesiella massiliensis]